MEHNEELKYIGKYIDLHLKEVKIDRSFEDHPFWPNRVIWSPKNGAYSVYLIYLTVQKIVRIN